MVTEVIGVAGTVNPVFMVIMVTVVNIVVTVDTVVIVVPRPLSSHKMEICFQLRSPAGLPPQKDYPLPSDWEVEQKLQAVRMLGELGKCIASDHNGYQFVSLSACRLVTMLTELSLLL